MECAICFDKIDIFCLGSCDNRSLCYKCMMRKRQIYKSTKCPICNREHSDVIMTKDASKDYNELMKSHNLIYKPKYHMYFDNEQLAAEVLSLLEFRCPICVKESKTKGVPAEVFRSKEMLSVHVSKVHNKVLCQLCLGNNKLFPYEQELYTEEEYKYHLGHTQKGQNSDNLIESHPKCKFCHKRFYNNQKLLEHIQNSHFYCIFCNDTIHYYHTKDELWDHYMEEHYVCDYPQCKGRDDAIFNDISGLAQHKELIHRQRDITSDFFKAGNRADVKKATTSLQLDRKLRDKKLDLFITKDVSGSSPEELEKMNQELYEDLSIFFKRDRSALNRFSKHSRNYVEGLITAVQIHDLYLNTFGMEHIDLMSRVISLIPDPIKKHTLEAIFREAKGRKASTLSKEFLESIGEYSPSETVHKSFSMNDIDMLAESSKKESEPSKADSRARTLSPVEDAKEHEVSTKKPRESSLDSLPKKVISPAPPLPSNATVNYHIWSAWHNNECTLTYLSEIKQKLVNKRDVTTSTRYYCLGLACSVIIQKLDEILYAKARAKEQWEGVSTDTLDEIRDIIDSQMEKSLGDVVFFHSYGISDHDCATFDEFYNLFKLPREPYYRLPMLDQNEQGILASLSKIPGQSLTLIRETFVLIFNSIEQRIVNMVTRAIKVSNNSKTVKSSVPSFASIYKQELENSKKKGNTSLSYSSVVKPSLAAFTEVKESASTKKTKSVTTAQKIAKASNTVNTSIWESPLPTNESTKQGSKKQQKQQPQEDFPTLSSAYKDDPVLVVDSSLRKLRNKTKREQRMNTFTTPKPVVQPAKPSKPATPKPAVQPTKPSAPKVEPARYTPSPAPSMNKKSVSLNSTVDFPSLSDYTPSKPAVLPKTKKQIEDSQGLMIMGVRIPDKLSKREIRKIEKQFRNMESKK